MLIAISENVARYWYLIPSIPLGIVLFIRLLQQSRKRQAVA